MQILKQFGLTVATTLLMLQAASAQRPSFAGSRPAGGLNQKDKYFTPQNAIAGSSDNAAGIANRFGADQPAPVTVAYGASQRPPTGVVLVHPETQYVPLPGTGPAAAAPAPTPTFSINNRVGESATPTQNTSQNSATATANAGNAAQLPAAAPAAAQANVPNRLPHDAHGDNELIQQLSRLPLEKQPFWFINYQAIEAHRNSSRPGVGALETRGSFFGG